MLATYTQVMIDEQLQSMYHSMCRKYYIVVVQEVSEADVAICEYHAQYFP